MFKQLKYVLIFVGFTQFGLALGQLTGNYTIGGSTGTNNFKNWTEFATEWNKNGLASHVNITVLNDDSLLTPLVLKQHSSQPTSGNRKITIDGKGKKLKANLAQEVLHLNGLDHFTLKNLQIINASTDAGIIGLRFSNGADSNVIDSCEIIFDRLKTVNGAKDSGAYIAFSDETGSITKASTKHRGVANVIRNCSMSSSLKESTGPFFGILDQQGSSDVNQYVTHNIFESNTISTFYSIGIVMKYVNGEKCIGNRITRENCDANSGTDSLMLGIFCLDSKSDKSALTIDKNQIVHLPYKNTSVTQSSSYILKLFAINLWKVIGGKNTVQVTNNRIEDLVFHEDFYGVFSQYGEQVNIAKNRIYDVRGNVGYSYGIYSQYGDDVHMDSNLIRKVDFGSTTGGNGVLIFGYEMQSGNWGMNTINGNILDSNTAYTELFMIPIMNLGSWDIGSNILLNNRCAFVSTSNIGRTVGVYVYFCMNVQIHDNLIANNYGDAETYYIFTTNYNSTQSLDVRHNTIYDTVSTPNYHISALMYLDDDSKTEVVGNIVQGKGDGEVYPMFLNTVNVLGDVKYNTIHVDGYRMENWAFETIQYSNFSDWVQFGARDTHTYWLNSKFVGSAKNDFRTPRFKNQNNVPFNSISSKDLYGRNRNRQFCDRGAILDTLNLSLVSHQKWSDTSCSGYPVMDGIYVKNQYKDTITRIEVVINKEGSYQIENFTGKLLPKDSVWIKFKKPVVLNEWGENPLKIYLGSSNDIFTDDTIGKKIWIKGSPGGVNITADLDSTQSNLPIINAQHIVMLLNKELAFRVSAPRDYNSSDYDTKWKSDISVSSASGKTVFGSQLTKPSSGSDLKWTFKTSDTQWEDSTLLLQFKIIDLLNGCDTVITKTIFIEPTVKIDFSHDSIICLGDTVFISNNTKSVGNSYLDYLWYFGNGDSIDVYEPIIKYKDTGSYRLTLKIRTQPYDYVFEETKTIRVNAGPFVAFNRTLACENRPFQFINSSKGKNAKFTWDFGDGKLPTLNNKDTITYSYTKRGNYDVQLTGLENGCVTKITQRIAVFEQPILQYSASMQVCNNQMAVFQDKTQMTTSIYGVKWDFGDSSAFNTQKTATHQYQYAGTKSVKYTVKSEFGCTDSLVFTVKVESSPKAQFTHDKVCTNATTSFKNITASVPGTIRQVQWNLNGMGIGNSDNLNYQWTDTGINLISLIIRLDNGCNDTMKEELRVLKSAVLDFQFDTLCSGDSVSFVNRSTKSNELTYTWIVQNDSVQQYDLKQVFDATSLVEMPVKLKVSGLGYCDDELLKQVSVLPRPSTCSFDFAPDYESSFFGAKFSPKNDAGVSGGQSGVKYTWDIEGLGRGNSEGINANYITDLGNNGQFNVMMIATTDAHGCKCSEKKSITLDRLNVEKSKDFRLEVFPNPAHSNLIYLKTFLHLNQVIISAQDGKMWYLDLGLMGQNGYELRLPQLSSGIYHLTAIADEGTFSSQVVISAY